MTRAVLALVLCTRASADDAPRDAPREPEVTLSYVGGALRDTTATFSARYTVRLRGATFAMGTTMLEMPARAAVTAIVVHAADGDHRLDLQPAETARAQFDATTGDGDGGRWAVLAERPLDTLDLSFAAPRAATLTIDVEISAPTCFFRDARYIEIPRAWKHALSPRLPTRARGCDAGDADAEPALFVAFPTTEAAPDRIGTNAARVDLGDAHLARLEVVAATRLGEIPRDLATVILVDGSRSLTAGRVTAQRELVKAYARAAGTSPLQVIAYARTARALLADWTPARIAKLDRALATLTPRNGSNIDAGVAEAVRWLGRTTGTKRIVLVTDEQYSRRIADVLPSLAVPPDVLVHVVAIEEVGELRRDLAAPASSLAERTGGIAVRAGIPEDHHPLDVTELLRPLRIDRFEVTAPGWRRSSRLTTNCGPELAEGTACRWFGEGDGIAGPLAASGYVWGRRWSRIVTPDPTRAVELARALANDGVLAEPAHARAQQLARAASSGWSFFAQWGPPGGTERGTFMIHGGSCCDGGRFLAGSRPSVLVGRIGSGARLPELDLAPQLAHVISLCDLVGVRVEADIETTASEIVEVRVVAPPPVSRCVEDAIWDTAISVPPRLAHATTHVVLTH